MKSALLPVFAVLATSIAVRSDPLEKALATELPSAEFADDATVGEVVAFLRAVTGKNLHAMPSVGDKELGKPIKLGPTSVKQVLRALAVRTGLDWKPAAGCLVVGTGADFVRLDARAGWSRIDGLDTRIGVVSFDADDLPVVAELLKAAAGLQLSTDESDAEISLRADGLTVADVLALVLPEGWTIRNKRGGGVHLSGAERLTFDYRDQPARKVVEVIATFTQQRIRLDDELAGKTVTLKLLKVEWPEGLRRLAKVLGGEARLEPNGAWRIAPAWRFAMDQGLKRTVTLSVQGRTLGVLLRVASPVPFAIDPGIAARNITVQLNNLPFATALAFLTEPNQLSWDVRWGVVFVATKERLAALPAFPGFAHVPDKTVKVAFDRTALPQAAKYLTRAVGVTLKVAPDAKALFEAGEVTLQGEVAIRHALAVMTLPYGLTVEAKKGTLVVRKR